LKRPIEKIPKNLNRNNINRAIEDYKDLLKNIPLKIESDNVFQMLADLKRKKLNSGPYPNVTLFESANRIMSDLTILHVIHALLNGAIKEIDFDEYHVEFGHDNNNDNDIFASNGKTKLIGEGFNVAKSFFQPKKTSALKKMRRQLNENDKLILIYNTDAVAENYSPKTNLNEYHLKVRLDF
jgi:hypothetical protein